MKKAYENMAKAIIDEIDKIIGPVAIVQANTVKGLNATTKEVKINGDNLKVISALISAYRMIMGDVAITLAKKGAAPIIEKNPKLKVPKELM